MALFALQQIDPITLGWPLHLGYVTGIVLLCAFACQRARQGDRPARLVSVSFIVLFIGMGAQTLLYYQAPLFEEALGVAWISGQSVQDAAFYLGFAGEAVFMSFAVLALVAENNRAARPDPERDIKAENRNKRFLAQLAAAVDRHLAEPGLDIRQLAGVLAMSERTLRRRLHEAAATTPAEYVRNRRLRHARALLKHNTYGTVAEVAHAVGLAHAGHFAKLYREAFGHPPRLDLNGEEAEGVPETAPPA